MAMYGKLVRPREWLIPEVATFPCGKLTFGFRSAGVRKVGVLYPVLEDVFLTLSLAEQATSIVIAEMAIKKKGCFFMVSGKVE